MIEGCASGELLMTSDKNRGGLFLAGAEILPCNVSRSVFHLLSDCLRGILPKSAPLVNWSALKMAGTQ